MTLFGASHYLQVFLVRRGLVAYYSPRAVKRRADFGAKMWKSGTLHSDAIKLAGQGVNFVVAWRATVLRASCLLQNSSCFLFSHRQSVQRHEELLALNTRSRQCFKFDRVRWNSNIHPFFFHEGISMATVIISITRRGHSRLMCRCYAMAMTHNQRRRGRHSHRCMR